MVVAIAALLASCGSERKSSTLAGGASAFESGAAGTGTAERRLASRMDVLAHDSGRPVGLLAEHVCQDTEPSLGFSVGSVDLVATAPEYRNNGVVPQLVSDTLDQFKRSGIRVAEVFAYSADVPTVRCCQEQGFLTVESSLILTHWRT